VAFRAPYALTVVAVSIVMLVIDAKLALFVLLPLPLVSVVAWVYSRRYDERHATAPGSVGDAATLVEETVSGIRVVKGLGAGGALSGRFRTRSDEIVGRALDVARLDALFNPALEVLPLIGIAAVLWVGGRQVISGGLSLGLFVAFNAYVVMLVWPLRVLGQQVSTLQKALAASARITEVLETEPRLLEQRHPQELEQPLRGDVRLESVRFGHEGDRPVLDGLELELRASESVALVGATGSGKSTVAGLLARLYDPDAGRVLLDGHDVRELRLADVRRAVALVFEETFLFTESVRDNIRFERPDADDESVGRAAALAGAAGVHRGTPGRVRDGARRARLLAVGRAADRDRAGDPRGSRGPRPRRCDLRGRCDQGARDSRGPGEGDARPDDPRDRTPAGDDRPGRPRRGARERANRRGRNARGALRPVAALPRTAGAREPGRVNKGASLREIWRETRGLIRPVRGRYPGAAAAVIASTLITLAGPALVRYAVDAGISKHARGPLDAAAVAFLCLAAAKPVVVRAQTLLAAGAGERSLGSLRVAAFDKLQALPLGFFERERAGVLLSQLTSDVQSLTEFIREALIEVVGSGLQIALTVVALVVLSPTLAAVSLVALPILIASSWTFHHSAGRVYHAIRERVAETLTALQEGLAGVRVPQAFRRERRTLEAYNPRSQAQVHAWRRASFVNIRLFTMIPLAQTVALLGVLLGCIAMGRSRRARLPPTSSTWCSCSTRSPGSASGWASFARVWPRSARSSACCRRQTPKSNVAERSSSRQRSACAPRRHLRPRGRAAGRSRRHG